MRHELKASNHDRRLHFANQSGLATLSIPIITGSPHFTCMRSHLSPTQRAAPKTALNLFKCKVAPDFEISSNKMADVPLPTTYRERLAQFKILEERRFELIEVRCFPFPRSQSAGEK